MKLILSTLLISASLYASSNEFKQNTSYICFNTYTLQKGEKILANAEKSKERPLEFIIEGDRLTTAENTQFKFMVEKDDAKSYVNEDFMLILAAENKVGLVPNQAEGELQFYFSCEEKKK